MVDGVEGLAEVAGKGPGVSDFGIPISKSRWQEPITNRTSQFVA
jgi:hypothetical protein